MSSLSGSAIANKTIFAKKEAVHLPKKQAPKAALPKEAAPPRPRLIYEADASATHAIRRMQPRISAAFASEKVSSIVSVFLFLAEEHD